MAFPQKVGKLETNLRLRLRSHAAIPLRPRPRPEPEHLLAPHGRRGQWERQPARSCATRSAPDIPLAGFSAALASHIFILTSHGLGPFPPLPSVSLLCKKKSLLENDVFCGRKMLKCSEEEFYELCFNTCCATSLRDFIIYDFI